MKDYELRPLESSDLFLLVKVVKKLDLNQLGNLQVDNQEQAGFELMNVILDGLGNCEQELYTLLGKLSNKKPDEVTKLPLATFIAMVGDVVKSEGFSDTMEQVKSLLKLG